LINYEPTWNGFLLDPRRGYPPVVLPMRVVKRPLGYLVVDCFELQPLRGSGIGRAGKSSVLATSCNRMASKAEDRA
jgi:hypothetical protein